MYNELTGGLLEKVKWGFCYVLDEVNETIVTNDNVCGSK